MMPKASWIVGGAASLLVSLSCNAAWMTGNQLKNELDAPNDSVGVSYIEGVFDQEADWKLVEIFSGLKSPNRHFRVYHWCFDQNSKVTLGQEIDVIKKYLNDHPEIRDHDANGLIKDAMVEVWPCAMNPISKP